MIRIRKYIFSCFVFILVLVNASCSGRIRDFEDLLKRVAETNPEERRQVINEYTQMQNEFPVVNDTTACFLYEASGNSDVYLFGDMCSWKSDSLLMNPIGGTNFHYLKQVFPRNARIEYKFVENKTALPDPLNKFRDSGPLGQNSVLFMPEYDFSKYVLLKRENALSAIDTINFKSGILNNTRNVFFYRPRTDQKIGTVVIFNDGGEYLKFANAQVVLDNLIAEKVIPPVYGVFINPVNRMQEYWLNEKYGSMIFHELLPQLKNKYELDHSLKVGMGGASLGGAISLFALRQFGSRLDFIFSQSGAFQIGDGAIVKTISELKEVTAKIYLSYGLYEGMEKYHLAIGESLLRNKTNYQVKKINEGHNWGNWRGHLPEALIFCLKDRENRP